MNLFNNIDNNTKDDLLHLINPIRREYLRGEKIFLEGDLCSSIAIIERGNIIARQSFSDGHDKIIKILNNHDCIGMNLIFSSNPYYKATFTAETLVTITLIYKDDLLKLMSLNNRFNLNVLSLISDESIRLNDHIKLLSYKTIREKICYFLYQEYLRLNQTSFLINYTKTELAAFLNVERPSLSYELSRLIKEGIIANQNKLYTIINLNKLEREL